MTRHGPTPKPGILDIKPYVPGESELPGGAEPIKLSSNETPLGPSPAAVTAFKAAATSLDRYPDGASTQLRLAIGKRYGLDADRIVCGNGSDELIGLLCAAYLGPGDEGIYSAHGFLMYKIGMLANGATPVAAPEAGLCASVDNLLAAVTERTKAVFLANPNNPTGTYLPIENLRRLRGGLPDHVLLVIDAAYCEYVRRNDYEAGIELVATTENTVMTRTFSKIYGLAALRLGWAYCPSGIADVLNRIRGPFNVSADAIAAGIAAIGDDAHITAAIEHNNAWLPRLTSQISDLGLSVAPSVGNFILITFPDVPGNDASAADAFLKSRNIILRAVAGYGLPSSLRMTIGTDAENQAVIAALREFTQGAGASDI